jgi:TfoX/Sxy family transcriptional regulator of competence genes
MPHDKNLAERIRAVLKNHPGWVEKKMFGGVGFILHGNLACGVQGNGLIVRVGPEKDQSALAQPFVRSFEGVPGRPMAGWVVVEPQGIPDDRVLHEWVEMGYTFASSLPAKG